MRDEFLPFSRPSIGDLEIEAVTQVLRSGWITTGPNAAAFEEAFAAYCGAADAVALCSATAGMHLLLAALNIGPGDEVITPSMTWVSTVNLIVLAGATPVFADVNRDTLMVSAETIEPLITERTRLIVPVHYAGAAVDMAPIRRLGAERGIFVAEDAAHAVGTEVDGRRVGAIGTAIFSLHPIKNMTTGEGGVVVSDDAELLARIRRLKFHGLGVDAYDRTLQGRAPQAEVQEPGYKYNFTDIAAALGLVQLERLDEMNAKRTKLAEHYRAALAEVPAILPLGLPPYAMRHSWHLFVVRLDSDRVDRHRAELMAALKQRNIGSGIHFNAVHLQRYYRESMPAVVGTLPHTEWNSPRILSLPLFPDMQVADVDDVIDALRAVLS